VPLIGLAVVTLATILVVFKIPSAAQLRAVMWIYGAYVLLELGVSVTGLANWLTGAWNLLT
jgi:hypothetical protein